jgi:hypothetical protein
MSYLYGDSSPSPLKTNVLEFLRATLEFSAHVLLSEERIKAGRARIGDCERETAENEKMLGALGDITKAAVHGAPQGVATSPTGRCASTIEKSIDHAVRSHTDQIHAALNAEKAKQEEFEGVERASGFKALEGLLTKTEAPDAFTIVTLETQEDGRYDTRVTATTPYGFQWAARLDIPESHPLHTIARLEVLKSDVTLSVPERSGWLSKQIKFKSQPLGGFYIVALSVSADSLFLKLRAEANGSGAGFDIEIARTAPRVRVERIVVEQATSPLPPVEVTEEDGAKILALLPAAIKLTSSLLRHGKELIEAKFEGIPFQDHRQQSEAVHRLVNLLAPLTQAIAAHSLAPTELVLKRLLGDDRREEIFVSKAVLLEKISPLPESLRTVFKPLALDPMASTLPSIPVSHASDPPAAGLGPSAIVTVATTQPLATNLVTTAVSTTATDAEAPSSVVDLGDDVKSVPPSRPPTAAEQAELSGASTLASGIEVIPKTAAVPNVGLGGPTGPTGQDEPGTLPGLQKTVSDLPGPRDSSMDPTEIVPIPRIVPVPPPVPMRTSGAAQSSVLRTAAERDSALDALDRSDPPAPPSTAPASLDAPSRVSRTSSAPGIGAAMKRIVNLAKTGKRDDAYAAYAELFASSHFAEYRPEDQRQALKFMVMAKNIPRGERVLEAFRSARTRLEALIKMHDEPADYELLGMCLIMLEDKDAASATFKTGLALERERSPSSALCGELMKRVSSI